MGSNEIVPRARDRLCFLRMRKVILATGYQVVGLRHDEMAAGDKVGVSFRCFGNETAAIGKPDKGAVPLEILLFRVMKVEQNPAFVEKSIAARVVQIASGNIGLGEAQRHKAY